MSNPHVPAHLNDLHGDYKLDIDPAKPHLFRIGRSSCGVEVRSGCEYGEILRHNPEVGGRRGLEAVRNSPGQSTRIVYFTLVDHSKRPHRDWSRRMVSRIRAKNLC